MTPELSYEERLKRQETNERRVLEFIAIEGVSTAAILSELLGYKHPQSVYKILRRLQSNKLIRARKFDYIGNLYLLTPAGVSALDENIKPKIINAGDINPISLKHRFTIQRCHIAMIKNHIRWEGFSGRIKKGEQRPDGAIWFCYQKEDESLIAIEVELTVKTEKRYHQIYLRYNRKYPLVIYVVPTETMKNKLESIFKKIEVIHRNGITQFPVFNFLTFADFSQRMTKEYSDARKAKIRGNITSHEK